MYTLGSARIPDTPGRDASAAEAKAVNHRELTAAFKGKAPFTFEGAARYEDGKTFLRRFIYGGDHPAPPHRFPRSSHQELDG